jgi:hypothetical protein
MSDLAPSCLRVTQLAPTAIQLKRVTKIEWMIELGSGRRKSSNRPANGAARTTFSKV